MEPYTNAKCDPCNASIILLATWSSVNPINEFYHLGLHKSRKKSHFICDWMGLMLFILCASCVYAKPALWCNAKINDCIKVTWHFLVANNTCLHMLPLLTWAHLRLYDPQRIYLNKKKDIFMWCHFENNDNFGKLC